MKVAITVWDGRISPVFDVCRLASIFSIEDGAVVSRANEALDPANALLKIKQLVDLGVETLICGAISEPLYHELRERGVRVCGFVAGDIEEVVQAFIAGRLKAGALAMPGCHGKRHRFRFGQGARGGGRGRGFGHKGRE